MWNALKKALTLAGWDLLATSNGVTYQAGSSPDLLPSAAAWDVSGAWCRMREPGGVGGREYVFMRGSANNTGIIKYSRATGFVSGPPPGNATTLPTTGVGGDGVVWLGSTVGQVDSSITVPANAIVIRTSTTGRVSCVASNTPVNGVYGWWMTAFTFPASSGPDLVMYTEAVQLGTYNTEDQDPSYRYCPINNPTVPWFGYYSGLSATSAGWPQAWEAYGLSGARYLTAYSYALPAIVAQNGTTFLRQMPFQGIGYGKYGPMAYSYPVLISNQFAWPKGFTTGVNVLQLTQNYFDVLNLTGSEPRIVWSAVTDQGVYVMPWVPNIQPIL